MCQEMTKANLERVMEDMQKGFISGEVEKHIKENFCPDAVTCCPDETVTGIAATVEYYKKMSDVWKDCKVGIDEVNSGGDYGFVRGTFTYKVEGKEKIGKYLTVWKKDAGKYKIYNDIYNMPTV